MVDKYLLLIFSIFISFAACQECNLHYSSQINNKERLLNQISLLNKQRFVVTANSFTYAVTICSEVSKNHPKAAATKSFNTDKNTTVIGRLNDTHIIGGNDWVLLTYESGDIYNNSGFCQNKTLKTSIMMVCNRESDETVFSLSDDDIFGDCQVYFTLKTAIICPISSKGLSKGSVFCVFVLTGGLMYLIIGIAYRRIMTGAQGVEQIPHYYFWRDLGNLQADGCNFLCRKGSGRDESWNRITSNFNDTTDEPLLHP